MDPAPRCISLCHDVRRGARRKVGRDRPTKQRERDYIRWSLKILNTHANRPAKRMAIRVQSALETPRKVSRQILCKLTAACALRLIGRLRDNESILLPIALVADGNSKKFKYRLVASGPIWANERAKGMRYC
jgi:hypothetical protein